MGHPPKPEKCSCFRYEDNEYISESQFVRLSKGWLCFGCSGFVTDDSPDSITKYYSANSSPRPSGIGHHTGYDQFPAEVVRHIDRLYWEIDKLSNMVMILLHDHVVTVEEREQDDSERD